MKKEISATLFSLEKVFSLERNSEALTEDECCDKEDYWYETKEMKMGGGAESHDRRQAKWIRKLIPDVSLKRRSIWQLKWEQKRFDEIVSLLNEEVWQFLLCRNIVA